ncbi:unnamed protein product [Durusdinium trenchii]|uniref:Beta-ketoacyl-[acyl-carrier-protein] synthase III N-terminal domain-containing protein n=1 Tax=Durusdinium trenchii TaxID=1381693 RepID=A0ABP0PM29_9DINO
METTDEWITQRTGIRRRHVLQPEESLVSLSVKAAKKALKDAQLAPEDVDLLIHATSTPDDLFGSGPQVASLLGAERATAFDLTAACSGFVFALVTAAQYVRSGAFKNVLVVGADCLSRFVDWSDRSTCVLFGDGAGAMVITQTEASKDEPTRQSRLHGFMVAVLEDPELFQAWVYMQRTKTFGDDQELPPSEEVHASLVCELMNEEGTEGMAGAATTRPCCHRMISL